MDIKKRPNHKLYLQVLRRLKHFIATLGHNPPYHLRLAADLGVLPLFVDWEKCWAIRSNGEVVWFRHDDSFTPDAESPNLRVEDDPRLRNLALFQGSKKYPELAALIPTKPVDAIGCPQCNGMGELRDLNPQLESIVCYCGGVGWLPKDYEDELQR